MSCFCRPFFDDPAVEDRQCHDNRRDLDGDEQGVGGEIEAGDLNEGSGPRRSQGGPLKVLLVLPPYLERHPDSEKNGQDTLQGQERAVGDGEPPAADVPGEDGLCVLPGMDDARSHASNEQDRYRYRQVEELKPEVGVVLMELGQMFDLLLC